MSLILRAESSTHAAIGTGFSPLINYPPAEPGAMAGELVEEFADETADAIFDGPATGSTPSGALSSPGGFSGIFGEKTDDLIGRYRLLQEIGEGGFGTVWMAEQMEPVTRRVALKIIKPAMDTRDVIARFGADRQALAMMDHPNISKVFDAGATAQGRFFVMEEGNPCHPVPRVWQPIKFSTGL